MNFLPALSGTVLSDDELAAVALMGIGFIGIVLLVALVWYILDVIAMWRLFKKAGLPGWKSIIPIYNTYLLYDKCWDTKWLWITMALSVASGICGYFSYSGMGGQFPGMAMNFFNVLAIFASIFFNLKLAQAYGKSKGFGFGLFFLNPIFMLILGLGGSTYVGKEGAAK